MKVSDTSKDHLEDKLEEQKRKHKNEIKDIGETQRYEREEWQTMMMSTQKKAMEEFKASIRKQQVEIRDKEI